jgi:large subunit ribosomal protein L18
MQNKQAKKIRRQKRVRAKICGTSQRPRLCVFRSGKHIYAQLIDDERGRTLVSAKDREIKPKTGKKKSSEKNGAAFEVGKLLAEKALKNKIEKAVFDKREYAYHGKIKSLAEGARKGGLHF